MRNWYSVIIALMSALPAQGAVASPANGVSLVRPRAELMAAMKVGAEDGQLGERESYKRFGATQVVAEAGDELEMFQGSGGDQKPEQVYFSSFADFEKFYTARLRYHDDDLMGRGGLRDSIVAILQTEGARSDPRAVALSTPMCKVELKFAIPDGGRLLYNFLRSKLTDVTNTPPTFAAPPSWGLENKVYGFDLSPGILTGNCNVGYEVAKRLDIGGRLTKIVDRVNAARRAELKGAYETQKAAEDQKMAAHRAEVSERIKAEREAIEKKEKAWEAGESQGSRN